MKPALSNATANRMIGAALGIRLKDVAPAKAKAKIPAVAKKEDAWDD